MISIANLIVISFKILIMVYNEKFWKQQGGRKTKGKMLSCFCESEEIFHHNWILVSYLKSCDFLHNLNSGGKKVRKGRKPPFSCLYEWEEIFQAALNYDFHRNVNCDFHHNLNNDFWWKILVRNKEILALMNQRRIFTILENSNKSSTMLKYLVLKSLFTTNS